MPRAALGLAVAVVLGTATRAGAQIRDEAAGLVWETSSTVRAAPQLTIRVGRGILRVRTDAGPAIRITARRTDPMPRRSQPRPPLFSLVPTVTGDSAHRLVDFPGGDPAELVVTVPYRTALLVVEITGDGRVEVSDFDGELVVTSARGAVQGIRLGGPVLVEAKRGDVDIQVNDLAVERGAVNLLAKSGMITVRLPAAPAVTLELQSRCGRIQSDFPLPTPPQLDLEEGLPGNAILLEQDPCGRIGSGISVQNRVLHVLLPPARVALNGGGRLIQAMALQGDVSLKRNR